ncbi:hypothetical protein AMK26_10335 [Streptomyces sp. CB03234]|uniref:hypothetical protein n=1 Tax=Streptomyces sp. (strain CB03234) TaxID=1703937 RepID=UPI00093D89B1|nr:hypothetical protein [Streptomyces sp. CB03234]OKK06414.1 hypothetical protein AMK26_10335 [Streptomyces sp. CB03234]
MFLIYQPDGQDEPTRWRYNPRRGLMAVEREDIERRTGMTYSEFTGAVLKGSSVCRRALLYTFLRRDHPKTRWEDVDFQWDELRLEYSQQEWQQMREAAADRLHGEELAAALEEFDRQMATAIDDAEESGKASLPVAD